MIDVFEIGVSLTVATGEGAFAGNHGLCIGCGRHGGFVAVEFVDGGRNAVGGDPFVRGHRPVLNSARLYGEASAWRAIAEANGLPNADLPTGVMQLTIPDWSLAFAGGAPTE